MNSIKTQPDCSIIIPVYFNEGSINLIYQELDNSVFSKNGGLIFETIFVDDGSGDSSLDELLSLKSEKSHDNIKIIRFTRNFGQVPAIIAGYMYAKGKSVINISADLQDPPVIINQMLVEFLVEKHDIVIATRIDRDESFYRKKTSSFFYNLIRKLSFQNMPVGGFDFVLLSERVKQQLINNHETNSFWQGQILWTGFSTKLISYHRQQRLYGKSRWTFRKKIKYLIDGVLGYSYLPIRLMSILGLIISVVGFLYAIVIIIERIFGNVPFKGWAPLMVLILILSGIQMLMLGIIGEYLWRTLDQVRNRPKFIIDQIYE